MYVYIHMYVYQRLYIHMHAHVCACEYIHVEMHMHDMQTCILECMRTIRVPMQRGRWSASTGRSRPGPFPAAARSLGLRAGGKVVFGLFMPLYKIHTYTYKDVYTYHN